MFFAQILTKISEIGQKSRFYRSKVLDSYHSAGRVYSGFKRYMCARVFPYQKRRKARKTAFFGVVEYKKSPADPAGRIVYYAFDPRRGISFLVAYFLNIIT